jgi:hypothetical protein
MSEIKYINLEDDRLWEILFDEACVEGGQAERIQKELEKIAIDEKEITRKPMQEILENLEAELLVASLEIELCASDNSLEIYSAKGYANGVASAIETVKEVGGMNGKSRD